MLSLFGSVYNDDIVTIASLILKWIVNETLDHHLMTEQMRNGTNEHIQLVNILVMGVGKRNVFVTSRLSSFKAKLDQIDNVNIYIKNRFVGL